MAAYFVAKVNARRRQKVGGDTLEDLKWVLVRHVPPAPRHAIRDMQLTGSGRRILHKAIKRLNPHLSMPSLGEEARDLDCGDQRYDRATAWLCNQTRDTEKLPLILAENVS